MSEKCKKNMDLNAMDCRGLWVRKDGETGRSMVEMLGTLAIVGVLSAGAIGGYSYAMNKHRTNELIYEATKQAQWAGTQKEMNRSADPTVTGGSFGGGKISPNTVAGLPDTKIGILLTDLDETVCDSLIKSIEQNPNGVVKAVRDETGTGTVNCESHTASLIFNRDLSTGELQEGSTESENEQNEEPQEDHCSGHGDWNGSSCDCDSDRYGDDCSIDMNCNGHGEWCGNHCYCHDSGWYGPDCSTQDSYELCNNNGYWNNGDGCVCASGWGGTDCSIENACSGNGYWQNSFSCGSKCICDFDWEGEACEVESTDPDRYENQECDTNADCGSQGLYFCQYTSVNCTTGHTAKGRCTKTSTIRGSGDGYVWSTDYMDWYSAANFCAANGKEMISFDDLDCPYTLSQYKSNDNWGYCCVDDTNSIGQQCGELATGTTTAAAVAVNSDHSSGIQAIQAAGAPITYYWTKTLTADYSCRAFRVDLSYGYVNDSARNTGDYALCR